MITIKRTLIITLTALFLLLGKGYTYSQDSGSGYTFTLQKHIKTTPVKNQMRTDACWSFAMASFLESEMLRIGQPEYDLSEIFFIRYAYANKANLYVRYSGTNNFGVGGQAHDVLNLIRSYGFTTQESYPDKVTSVSDFLYPELESVLKASLDEIVKNPNERLTTTWLPALDKLIEGYLGSVPNELTVNGKKYTPKSFFESTNLNLDDYVEITSFTHHPYYQKFILEIPDNWQREKYFNLPLSEFIAVIENSLNNGYSVCWNGDITEKGFNFWKGVAILPAASESDLKSSDVSRWSDISEQDRKSQMFAFNGPVPELNVTSENRQLNFDNQTTTDDHLLHFVGTATDQNGTKYFYAKNSWGTEKSMFNGYFYLSESYVKMKTIAILVHKDAIPTEIAAKMGIVKVRGIAK
jgi:bleomycin hydrolase